VEPQQLLLLPHQLPHLQVPVAVPTTPHVGQAFSAGLSDTVGEHDHAPHVAVGHLHLPHRVLYDWTARIVFKKFELGVPLFLGEVPEDADDWQVGSNYVGGHHALKSAAAQCTNCADQADVIEEGFVHLKQAILKHSDLNSLEPLQWRVQKVTFPMLPADSSSSLLYSF